MVGSGTNLFPFFHSSFLFGFSPGGKKCPKCKQRIFHDRFNMQPKLAEDRWAHQEARKREIAEVADFLGV